MRYETMRVVAYPKKKWLDGGEEMNVYGYHFQERREIEFDVSHVIEAIVQLNEQGWYVTAIESSGRTAYILTREKREDTWQKRA